MQVEGAIDALLLRGGGGAVSAGGWARAEAAKLCWRSALRGDGALVALTLVAEGAPTKFAVPALAAGVCVDRNGDMRCSCFSSWQDIAPSPAL